MKTLRAIYVGLFFLHLSGFAAILEITSISYDYLGTTYSTGDPSAPSVLDGAATLISLETSAGVFTDFVAPDPGVVVRPDRGDRFRPVSSNVTQTYDATTQDLDFTTGVTVEARGVIKPTFSGVLFTPETRFFGFTTVGNPSRVVGIDASGATITEQLVLTPEGAFVDLTPGIALERYNDSNLTLSPLMPQSELRGVTWQVEDFVFSEVSGSPGTFYSIDDLAGFAPQQFNGDKHYSIAGIIVVPEIESLAMGLLAFIAFVASRLIKRR